MTDHIVAVIGCWLLAIAGLAMFKRATSWKGLTVAHAALLVSLLSLSAMALDHDHRPRFSPLVSAVGDSAYHRAGCPYAHRGIVFRSADEAEWASKLPCTYCLAKARP